jgi:hypothetical protein
MSLAEFLEKIHKEDLKLMPCYSPYSDLELKLKFELDLTTRFACECLTKLEEENSPIPEYIKGWWEGHKEWDRRREENEQKQKERVRLD